MLKDGLSKLAAPSKEDESKMVVTIAAIKVC